MKGLLNYKGYHGSIEADMDAGYLHGKVLHIQDLITYEGESLPELKLAFESMVDDYIQTCDELGRTPQKPFSGSFNIRIGAELHKRATIEARRCDMSLNEFMRETVEERLSDDNEKTVCHVYNIR